MAMQKRLRGLDGFRGIAVFAVVAYHYEEQRAYYGLLGVELSSADL
jgi:peptidoglycan/LPS O-acetylase OafA/YrhL